MGSIKDRNGMDLTEAEDKKRLQEYTEKLYKKRSSWPRKSQRCYFSPRARHPGMWSQVGLRNIITNKASGCDGIPVELFQILNDDAVKVLLSICQQIWKTQQWTQDWKRSVFIPIPKESNANECSNYYTIALISHASKVVVKKSPSQASAIREPWTSRCSSWFWKRPRNQRSNCQHPLDHRKSKRDPKKSISALLTMPKPLTVWITINCGKYWRRW